MQAITTSSALDGSPGYNRGAYLVTALCHCGEYHTPRNALGATRPSLQLAGNADGPDGQIVPNITPDPATGIGQWQKADLDRLLKTGVTPEQTTVKGFKYLRDDDLEAIPDYLMAQPPIVHEVTEHQ